jgi:hypothetical protein
MSDKQKVGNQDESFGFPGAKGNQNVRTGGTTWQQQEQDALKEKTGNSLYKQAAKKLGITNFNSWDDVKKIEAYLAGGDKKGGGSASSGGSSASGGSGSSGCGGVVGSGDGSSDGSGSGVAGVEGCGSGSTGGSGDGSGVGSITGFSTGGSVIV